MNTTVTCIIFIILLIDSISANLVAWFGQKWYTKHFRIFSRLFPITTGWALWYLVLVLWIGLLTFW